MARLRSGDQIAGVRMFGRELVEQRTRARTLLEMATMTVVVVLVTTGMILLGLSRPPHDLLETASGLLSLTLLGAGIGFINAVLQPLFATWDRMFQILTRPLYFLSGIFFVADMLPPSVRDLLAWNPVLHGVEWFRSGYFTDYSSHMLDREYILGIAFGCLFVGLAMERALRRRVRNVA
jgi:capsular polysaccharide transport system permease protein